MSWFLERQTQNTLPPPTANIARERVVAKIQQGLQDRGPPSPTTGLSGQCQLRTRALSIFDARCAKQLESRPELGILLKEGDLGFRGGNRWGNTRSQGQT